jgi:hypothetical protein
MGPLKLKKKGYFFMGKWNYQIIDHDSEGSSVGVNIVDLDAGNIVAQTTLIDALRDAIDAVIVGTPRQEQLIAVTSDIPGVAPASGWAQRETKWLVSGVDTQGLTSTLEIPTADLTALAGGTKNLDISAGVGLALATALNNVWISRAGNAVTVSKIVHVGRNL